MQGIRSITSKKTLHPIKFTRLGMTTLPIIIPETDLFPFNDPWRKPRQPQPWPYHEKYYCPWGKPWRPLPCHYYCRKGHCIFV